MEPRGGSAYTAVTREIAACAVCVCAPAEHSLMPPLFVEASITARLSDCGPRRAT